MPRHDRPARDLWPVLPSTTDKLVFDTPARAFLSADGWEECRFERQTRRAKRTDGRLLMLARAVFVILAIAALVLGALFAVKLFVGSVGAVAPVATLVVLRLD